MKISYIKKNILNINQTFPNFYSKINNIKFNLFKIIYRGFTYGKFIIS